VHVLRCQDATQALTVARGAPLSAVILDIRLPGMDGWELLEVLKSNPDTEKIPVFLVTIVDERSRGLALGASAYLTKPVRREDLIEALRDAGVLDSTQQTLEVQ
jgi:CheY-like chemotaxis protein